MSRRRILQLPPGGGLSWACKSHPQGLLGDPATEGPEHAGGQSGPPGGTLEKKVLDVGALPGKDRHWDDRRRE